MAVMDDLISESSNVVGVSSTGQVFGCEGLQTTHTQVNLYCEEQSCELCFCHLSTCPPSDPFPPAELPDEGLARPVVAGVVATICFLAAAVLFSTLAACFVNKQHRRKLKRKPGRSPSPLNSHVLNMGQAWISERAQVLGSRAQTSCLK